MKTINQLYKVKRFHWRYEGILFLLYIEKYHIRFIYKNIVVTNWVHDYTFDSSTNRINFGKDIIEEYFEEVT